jgi:hypothetical protein
LCGGPRIQKALAAFKGNINKEKLHRQIVLPYSYNNPTKIIGVIKGSFLAPAVSLTTLVPELAISKSNIRSHLQKGFNQLIRAQVGLFDEKNKRSKIS